MPATLTVAGFRYSFGPAPDHAVSAYSGFHPSFLPSWCGHVSDLLMRHIAPPALMPSAHQILTKSAHSKCWVELGSRLLIRRFQPTCCISFGLPSPTSSAKQCLNEAGHLCAPRLRPVARRAPWSRGPAR
jgi:hypothetical protein